MKKKKCFMTITSLAVAGVMLGSALPPVTAGSIHDHQTQSAVYGQSSKAWDFSQIQAGYGYENWGTKQYVPYFDVGAYPQNPLLMYDYMTKTGTQQAFLGFLVTNPQTDELVWSGSNKPVDVLQPNGRDMIFDDIRRLREQGKDLGIAVGGAGATMLPETVKSAEDAVKEYKEVLTAYGFTHLDFDIEGNLTPDKKGHENRAKVIKQLKKELQSEGQPLSVSYTLALGKSGIEPKEVAIIEPAIKEGVDISRLNFMAFDYGEINESLVETTIKALRSTHTTLKDLYQKYGYDKTDADIWNLMGITSMTAQDDQGHPFTLKDVQATIDFANSVGIPFLSMWSINRDSNDNSWVHPGTQEGDYSKAFVTFISEDGSKDPFKPIPTYSYPKYDESKSYNAGERVGYNGKAYLCIGWANPHDNPEAAPWAWKYLK